MVQCLIITVISFLFIIIHPLDEQRHGEMNEQCGQNAE